MISSDLQFIGLGFNDLRQIVPLVKNILTYLQSTVILENVGSESGWRFKEQNPELHKKSGSGTIFIKSGAMKNRSFLTVWFCE
jgi:hypothetical protein